MVFCREWDWWSPRIKPLSHPLVEKWYRDRKLIPVLDKEMDELKQHTECFITMVVGLKASGDGDVESEQKLVQAMQASQQIRTLLESRKDRASHWGRIFRHFLCTLGSNVMLWWPMQNAKHSACFDVEDDVLPCFSRHIMTCLHWDPCTAGINDAHSGGEVQEVTLLYTPVRLLLDSSCLRAVQHLTAPKTSLECKAPSLL